MTRRTIRAFFFLAIAFSCRTVCAQQTPIGDDFGRGGNAFDEKPLTIDLFKLAVEEFEAGNIAAACRHFNESFEWDRNLDTLLSLAVCLEKQEKPASALTRYKQFLDESSRRPVVKNPRDIAKQKRAVAKVEELKARAPRLTIKANQPVPRGWVILVDGEPLPLGETRLLDPGKYKVVVRMPGRTSTEWEAVLQDRQELNQLIRIRPVPTLITSQSRPNQTSVSSEAQNQQKRRIAGMVTGGTITVAALGTVGYRLVTAWSDRDEIALHCPDGLCDTTEWSKKSREADRAIGDMKIGLTVGAVGGMVFLASYLALAPQKPDPQKPRVEASIFRLDSTGAMFGLKGSF